MRVQPCKRWTLVHDHDGSPVDGCTYVHKDKAQKRMLGMSDPAKFRIERVAIMSAAIAEMLLTGKTMAEVSNA
jgi:hypothetical protein